MPSSQTFSNFRTNNCVYVDKTQYLLDLIRLYKFIFLARPRRFGKSLTVSTFVALFSGKKELFQGLAAAEWFERPGYKPYTVISLDMSGVSIKFGAEEMNEQLLHTVKFSATINKLQIDSEDPSIALVELVTEAYRTYNEKIVLLIDEYDKPMTDSIDETKEFLGARKILLHFYSQIKPLDKYIKFCFITSISQLSRSGVKDALYNFHDITYDERYSCLCGYTRDELLEYFSGHLSEYAKKKNLSFEDLLAKIDRLYGGFSFDGKNKVYNPFSVSSFLSSRELDNFWFHSASPTALVKYFSDKKLIVGEFINHKINRPRLINPEEFYDDPVRFLLQTGYLTIKEKISDDMYLLDYTNEDILALTCHYITDKYFGDIETARKPSINITAALKDCDIPAIIAEFNNVFVASGYDTYLQSAKAAGYNDKCIYRDLLAIFLCGTLVIDVWHEVIGSKKRSDMLLKIKDKTFIFEINVVHKKDNALKELKSR
jgi:hypothetical protein